MYMLSMTTNPIWVFPFETIPYVATWKIHVTLTCVPSWFAVGMNK